MLRVSSTFVSKFDQAMYWMDRAKRAGVPRKMQIEGFLEELKLDLMDILVPGSEPVNSARVSRLEHCGNLRADVEPQAGGDGNG